MLATRLACTRSSMKRTQLCHTVLVDTGHKAPVPGVILYVTYDEAISNHFLSSEYREKPHARKAKVNLQATLAMLNQIFDRMAAQYTEFEAIFTGGAGHGWWTNCNTSVFFPTHLLHEPGLLS